MKFLNAAASVLFAICFSHPVFAQETNSATSNSDQTISLGLGIPDTIDFHGHIGLAVGAFPEYEGSDNVAAVGLPLVDIRQDDFLFLRGASVNPSDGYGSIGWNALNFRYSASGERKFGLSVGPIIRFAPGREEDDDSALTGLGDIDSSVGTGGFVEARAGNWFADVSAVSQDAGEAGDGTLVAMRTGFDVALSPRLTLSPGAFASWGDDDYMQGYYGVSAAQSARSGLAPFAASSGFKDVGLQIGMTYAVSQNFLITGLVGYQRLLDDAADSPIIDRSEGSRDQFRALFGGAYKF